MAGMATVRRSAARPVATVLPARTGVRVSVVIPTYNRSASLQRLLRALANSAVPAGGMEVVVVDDGSTDETRSVALAAEVRCLTQPNYGPAAARERGWRSTQGDVVVFLDDDVVPEPEAVIAMADALGDGVDGVGAAILPLNDRGVISHYMQADGLVDHRVVKGDVRWLITAAAAFRREALERVGGFDLTFPRAAGEDVDLTLRMIEAGCALRLEPRAVVRHDHRSRFRQLLGTCYRYGTAYKLLASRHRTHSRDRRRNALLRLSPYEWWLLYKGYRLQTSIRRSLMFMLLHALVSIPYACGVVAGKEPSRDPDLIRDIDLANEEVAIELNGAPQAPGLAEYVAADGVSAA